jgi:hypothetical protein
MAGELDDSSLAAIVTAGALVLSCVGVYWFFRGRLFVCSFIAPAFLMTLVIYLMGLIPAFSARHLSFVWPFIALALAVAVGRFHPVAPVGALALMALVVGPTEAYVAHKRNFREHLPKDQISDLIRNAKHIVVSNTAVGILPRYLIDARDDAMVYASPGLKNGLPPLRPGTVIILNQQYLRPDVAERAQSLADAAGKRVSQAWTTTVYLVPVDQP